MDQPCHTIKMAAKLTGLSAHVIRIWEKRYGAVRPQRSHSRRRLYGDQELQRLSLLRRATEQGHNIGAVATLPEADLRELVRRAELGLEQPPDSPPPGAAGQREPELDFGLEDLLRCLQSFDQKQLVEHLRQAHVALGCQGLLMRVVAPLTQAIGEEWARGALTAAQEHFASAVIRDYLLSSARQYPTQANPVLVVATPAGQVHEMGAVLVTFAARSQGWNAIYLGASLPAAEIAGAALRSNARLLALSLVFPTDDPTLPPELLQLRKALPSTLQILAGGRGAKAYQATLRRIGAVLIEDLPQLFDTLNQLRRPAA